MGNVDIRYRGKSKMTIRDKIADIIYDGGILTSYRDCADTIMAVLPDYEAQQTRVIELEAAYGEACDRIAELGAALRAIEDGVLATRAVLKGETK
jgi:hypothetical protein